MKLRSDLWRWAKALGVLMLFCPPGIAQELPDPSLLIAEVLEFHPAIKRATHQLEAAQAVLGGSRAQPNPTLTLAASAGDAGEDSNSLVQTFEISGQPRLRREQAQARLQSAQLQLRLTRRQVASQAYSAWLELWEKGRLLSLAQQRRKLIAEMSRVSQRRYQVGEIPLNETLRAELAASEAEAALAMAQAEYEGAARSLEILRQQSLEQPLPLVSESGRSEPLEPPQGPPLLASEPPWSLQEIVLAAEQQLELAALRQEEKALQLGAELAGKENAPQLGVSLYRSRFLGSSVEQGAQLFISWPIFDWGRVSAQKKVQLAEAQAQSAAVEEKALQLRREVAEIWNRWRSAQTVRDLLSVQAARYEELSRKSRVGYDLGLLGLTDVLQTESEFRQAGVELILSQAQIRRLELELLERTNLPWPNQLLEER